MLYSLQIIARNKAKGDEYEYHKMSEMQQNDEKRIDKKRFVSGVLLLGQYGWQKGESMKWLKRKRGYASFCMKHGLVNRESCPAGHK